MGQRYISIEGCACGNSTSHKEVYGLSREYTKKYGENTVVLMQAGSHFNLFAIINDEVNLGPDIYHICTNVLNNALQVTKQNKKKPEIRIVIV